MPTFNTTDPKPGYVYDAALDTWFPLVGIAPGSSVVRWRKTAAGGETSFTGLDDLGATLSYNAGTEQVYLNGVLLVRTEDYTATNGTSVTALNALAASDVIEVISFNATNVQVTDALLKTDINAKGDLFVGAAVDTSAILASGTNGQVLKVNTATTSGLEWGSLAADIEGVTAGTGLTGGGTSGTVTLALDSAAVIAPTIVDAKGDIIAASADNTPARLAVGTNGQVLTAASGQTTGLQWTTISTGSNFTLLNTGGTALSGSATVTISSLSGYDKIRILVKDISSASGSSTISLRINADNGSNYNMFGAASRYVSSTTEGMIGRFNGPTETFARVLVLGDNAAANGDAAILIDGANSTGIKIIEVHSGVNGISGAGGQDYNSAIRYNLLGTWNNSAIVTSVSLLSSSGNFDAGTIFVYGSL